MHLASSRKRKKRSSDPDFNPGRQIEKGGSTAAFFIYCRMQQNHSRNAVRYCDMVIQKGMYSECAD
jgi:hypothetical protein